MMPRNELNTESKMSAWSGASLSPSGWGMRSTTALSISSTPSPVLPDALMMSLGSQPMRSTISSSTSSGMALGMSILLMTGIISRLWSMAMYRFDMVCACTPCVASTTSRAPSHAAMLLDTSYEKSTWPGVSMRLSMYFCPSSIYSIWMAWLLMVMPRSRSRSMSSSICPSVIFIVLVRSSRRSAMVDLPWSIWAMIQKFLILSIDINHFYVQS